MRCIVGILLLAASAWSVASERPLRIVVDATAYSLTPAMSGAGFQSLPDDGVARVWKDPVREGGPVMVPLLLPIPTVMHYDPRPGWRLEGVAPLLKLADDDLRPAFDQALAAQLPRHGWRSESLYSGVRASDGYLRRLGERDGVLGLVIERDKELPLLSLSWDNRQLLLSATFRTFVQSRSKRAVEREQTARTVRYVSASVQGEEPLAAWSRDGASAVGRELQRGWSRLLGVGLESAEVPQDVGRDEIAVLQVDGREQRFMGRLWRTLEGAAHVVDSKGRVTIVELGPMTEPG